MTAIRLEFDAALKVNTGAVLGSHWELESGPSGLPVAYRSFLADNGRPLRVAVAVAAEMGATAATNTLGPLVEQLHPRWIAMCGVCAGPRGKVQLGDVVVADRVYFYDAGKQVRSEVQQDITTYNLLRDDWKASLQSFDAAEHFRREAWLRARPLTCEWRENCALLALRNGSPPWRDRFEPPLKDGEWKTIVEELRMRELIASTCHELTDKGQSFAEDLLFQHTGRLPDLSPWGTLHPFRLHVGPMATGTRVVEDETVWTFISKPMRKTLGLEMEAASIGEFAHRQHQHKLRAVVMKGVMDFADHGRDDHFKEFAAQAAAECLLWFLRRHVETEAIAGFDDLLSVGAHPLPNGNPALSTLLNARYAVVPWHDTGRADVLAQLDAWADDPSRLVAVQLLHSDGGLGKTRLAIEWVLRRLGRCNAAGFLAPRLPSSWFERLCGLGLPVLIVIDYAESRSDLIEVLQRIAAYAASQGPRRRVRVLLLARNDGDWWTELNERDTAVRALLAGAAPIELRPLATGPERARVFEEAAKQFVALKQRARLPEPPPLEDPRFERVLYIHMAALLAVEGIPPASAATDIALTQPAQINANSLLDDVLVHEERFWASAGQSPAAAKVEERLARQLVAAATIRGGFTTPEQALAVCRRLKGRPCDRGDETLLELLHYVYQRSDTTMYLPPLEPDLLGEAMVVRVAMSSTRTDSVSAAAWILRIVDASDDAGTVATAFMVLGRLSGVAAEVVRPWIVQLLAGPALGSRAVLALRAAKAVGKQSASSMLGDVLADVLEIDGSDSIADGLEREGIPHPTVSLRRVAEWQARIQLQRAPLGNDDESLSSRAARLLTHAVRLRDLGRREDALPTAEQAVQYYRALASRAPDEFEPQLAKSLNIEGTLSSELGRHAPAFAAMREAVVHCRSLVRKSPDRFLPELARSLNNLGTYSRDDPEGALAVLREAVRIRRMLVETNPDAFLPDLAMSLSSLSRPLSESGAREPALAAAREAETHYRAAANKDADTFTPALAMSLHSVGMRLHELRKDELALEATQEAAQIRQSLAAHNPGAFDSDLAATLHSLGSILRALGQLERALETTQRAVEIRRRLAEQNAQAFTPDLAASLDSLGVRWSALKQHEAAAAATQEAVELYRRLTDKGQDVFASSLAGSLHHLGLQRSELGQHDVARAATQEAVSLYYNLAAIEPDRFAPQLAASSDHLGVVLRFLGQHELALTAAQEAVDMFRSLVAKSPDAFNADLARSQHHLGSLAHAMGQRQRAVSATQGAVDIRRALAKDNPAKFTPDLAMSLHSLAVRLRALDQPDLALDAVEQAVNMYRVLAANDPDAFDRELARCLHNQGTWLRDVGLAQNALVSTQEAVTLGRKLAAKDPDALIPELATSLHNLGVVLHDLGESQQAVKATHEAATLRRTLAAKDPDTFRGDFALSLFNLRIQRLDPRKPFSAFEATQAAMEQHRKLVAKSRREFISDLERGDYALDIPMRVFYEQSVDSQPSGGSENVRDPRSHMQQFGSLMALPPPGKTIVRPEPPSPDLVLFVPSERRSRG